LTPEKVHSLDGLRTFSGIDEVRTFGSNLLGHYEAKVDYYNQKLDTLLRQQGNNTVANRTEPPVSKGWIKVGALFVNVSNPAQAMSELLFKMKEECRLKMVATKAFLDSLDNILNLGGKKDSTYHIYLRNGVPERIVIEESKHNSTFKYSARFQVIAD
jgi:hypothetical protein